MTSSRHLAAGLSVMFLLVFARSAGAQGPDDASAVALFQFGMLFRLDGVPTRPDDPYSSLDSKDSAVAFHGNAGVLVPVGEGRWLGPAMVWTVNEVGGFVGLELRHRMRLPRDSPRPFPSLDLSAGVLVTGELEDFQTELPGFTAGVNYNLARAASLTARFDAYRYTSAGGTQTGSDLYLGVLTGSWLLLVSVAAFFIALGASWE